MDSSGKDCDGDDNLNTHSPGSFSRTYDTEEALRYSKMNKIQSRLNGKYMKKTGIHGLTRLLEVGFILWITLAVLLALAIAQWTKSDSHPDERIHIDAFCYYQSHWWPPDINDNSLLYSPDGWSRVYNGELVYLVFGKMGEAITGTINGAGNLPMIRTVSVLNRLFTRFEKNNGCYFKIPRFLNVLLYFLTLSILYYIGRKHSLAISILIILLCVPQVTYIYGYANSDGWGLSMSIFFFLFVFYQKQIFLSPQKSLFLGLLLALVLLSKQNFWISVPFSLVILFSKNLDVHQNSVKNVGKNLLLLFGVTFLLTAPYSIVFPVSQGDYTRKAEQMREERSSPRFKPSYPDNPYYRSASKGIPLLSVVRDPRWLKSTLMSFYGVFGYFKVWLPSPIYLVVGLLGLALLSDVLITSAVSWREITLSEQVFILCGFVSIALHILASIYNSWTYDFQPQGRYLFSVIPSLAYLLYVTGKQSNLTKTIFRSGVLILGLGFYIYSLIIVINSQILTV